ncbi:MAG TPA: GC-type dockerin domain-anchored protein, partial [Phycisphaerales bacterium]|nr:GC-type dockerin domain-anchored protein [Phycisphaerales bacterium]
ALPGQQVWAVQYRPTQAILRVTCRADINADGTLNTQDVLAFLNAWTAGDPTGDFNRDGNINTLDVLAFLNSWTSGC